MLVFQVTDLCISSQIEKILYYRYTEAVGTTFENYIEYMVSLMDCLGPTHEKKMKKKEKDTLKEQSKQELATKLMPLFKTFYSDPKKFAEYATSDKECPLRGITSASAYNLYSLSIHHQIRLLLAARRYFFQNKSSDQKSLRSKRFRMETNHLFLRRTQEVRRSEKRVRRPIGSRIRANRAVLFNQFQVQKIWLFETTPNSLRG